MTTSLTFNTKKQSYADLPKVKHSKNLGNNDSFSKILVTKILEVCDEKRVKEQLALPLLDSGRCAHRPRYNRHIAVTILVNASKPRFKGSYSDVRRSPHRMHSVSVRRGPRSAMHRRIQGKRK